MDPVSSTPVRFMFVAVDPSPCMRRALVFLISHAQDMYFLFVMARKQYMTLCLPEKDLLYVIGCAQGVKRVRNLGPAPAFPYNQHVPCKLESKDFSQIFLHSASHLAVCLSACDCMSVGSCAGDVRFFLLWRLP